MINNPSFTGKHGNIICCAVCKEPLTWDNTGCNIPGTDLYFCDLAHEERFRDENDLTPYLSPGATLKTTQLDMRWNRDGTRADKTQKRGKQ